MGGRLSLKIGLTVDNSLYSLLPLLEPLLKARCLRDSAWEKKQLNTALGSYAELKHDTILYAAGLRRLGGGDRCPVSAATTHRPISNRSPAHARIVT
jgi:hypothetical protein